jgi:hypothetical protein
VRLGKVAVDGAAHGSVGFDDNGAVDHLTVAPAGHLGRRNKVGRVNGGRGAIKGVAGGVAVSSAIDGMKLRCTDGR